VTIAIVNYGAGNLASVKKAFDVLGENAVITADPELVARAEKIVVPGVGHFATTSALEANGLRSVLQGAIAQGKPVLGICLGMQWLFESSTEAPQVKGIGVLRGACAEFPAAVKSPHVGWNELERIRPSRLLDSISERLFVYFSHSFRAPIVEQTVASCDYGEGFSAVIEQDRIFGVQFHPEKSGSVGRKLLQNFCELPC
jgi:imidazole glycerol-phosphate synthase subunit HisH